MQRAQKAIHEAGHDPSAKSECYIEADAPEVPRLEALASGSPGIPTPYYIPYHIRLANNISRSKLRDASEPRCYLSYLEYMLNGEVRSAGPTLNTLNNISELASTEPSSLLVLERLTAQDSRRDRASNLVHRCLTQLRQLVSIISSPVYSCSVHRYCYQWLDSVSLLAAMMLVSTTRRPSSKISTPIRG